ncbi:MAG: DNA polymerase III subunit beta [Oscillospiraceae bacterium]|nr:DNA polymerase III subunit beta [Oscillospiraceae bacterium]
MQFTCNKENKCKAIAHVLKAVSSKSTLPVLEGICIHTQENQITLTGYNLEIGIRTTIPATCNTEFTFVLNAKLFYDMVRKMPEEEITFEIDRELNAMLSSSSGNTHYRISAISAEDFPELPVVESTAKISVPQEILRTMIQESRFAASEKEDQPILTGELFEARDGMFFIVAMDRYRLALRQEPFKEMQDFHFVVPKKALEELIGILALREKNNADATCEFFTNGRHIVFCVNGFELFARLLEGKFHNFRTSIPNDSKTTVILNKRDIIACAERCSLLINEKNKAPMRCVFTENFIEISCETSIGSIRDRIPAENFGENVTIGLGNKFLLDALKACQCDKVRFQMSGSNKVIKITPIDDESFIYLIMPTQLRN